MKTKARTGLQLGGNKFRFILKLKQLCISVGVVGIERNIEASSKCSRFLGTKLKACNISTLSIRFLQKGEESQITSAEVK